MATRMPWARCASINSDSASKSRINVAACLLHARRRASVLGRTKAKLCAHPKGDWRNYLQRLGSGVTVRSAHADGERTLSYVRFGSEADIETEGTHVPLDSRQTDISLTSHCRSRARWPRAHEVEPERIEISKHFMSFKAFESDRYFLSFSEINQLIGVTIPSQAHPIWLAPLRSKLHGGMSSEKTIDVPLRS